jgi:hypothetical protein
MTGVILTEGKRPADATPERARQLRERYSVIEIAKMWNVSRARVYQLLAKAPPAGSAKAKGSFEAGKRYYEQNKDLLAARYAGEYIAVLDRDVIDHDASFSSLAQRVYKRLGYVSVYMPQVAAKRRVLRFESPEVRF